MATRGITTKKMNSFCSRCKRDLQIKSCPYEDDRLACKIYTKQIYDLHKKIYEDDANAHSDSYYASQLRLLGYKGELRKKETITI